MSTKNQKVRIRRMLIILLLILGVFFSTFGTGNLPSVRAQGLEIPPNEELGNRLKKDLEDFGRPLPPGFSLVVDNNKNKDRWIIIAYYSRSESNMVGNQSLGIGKLVNSDWKIISPANPQFNGWLRALPSSLLNEDAKALFNVQEATAAAYSGHRLPWQGGISRQVTSGVGGHSSPVEYWAYDFGMPNGTELWASYGGTVAYVTQQYGSGACNPDLANQGNRVVVNNDDGSASLYLHLQQNGARVSVGQRVNRGDLIGLSGNSGYVCPTGSGYHLHFQVQLQGGSWWTQSQQVIFDPNGEPAVGTSPVSGNYRSPSGGPSGYTFCANEGGYCSFSGTADVAYGANGSFNYKYGVANGINCDNNTFGDPISGTPKACYYKLTSTPPICNPNSDQIALYEHPNYSGACKVLGVGDYANPSAMGFLNDAASSIKVGSNVKVILYESDNYSGASEEFSWDDSDFGNNTIGHDRASSAKVQLRGCNPNSNQIALYAGTSYTGACITLGIGDYSNPGSLNPVGNDNAESIRVGSNVQAILCEHDNYQGRCSTLSNDEINLGNHSIGGNSVSSVRVQTRACNAPTLSSPLIGSNFNEGEAINLSWSGTCSEYYGEVMGGPGGTLTFGWQTGTSKNLGTQWAGYSYTWRIKGRNGISESNWSSTSPFTVRPAAPSNLTLSVISCSQINLSWSDNSGNEEGYRVYRNGTAITTLPSGSTSFQNTGLSQNTPYPYKITAYRGSIESNFSVTATATTTTCPAIPNTPINFRVSGSTQTSITTAWDDVSNETGYKIYEWDGTSFVYLASVGANVTSYTETRSACGWDEFYEVSAYNSNGESAHASWVHGYTQPCPPIDDTTPPNVSWLAPVGDTHVYDVGNQTIQLEVNAGDNIGISEVVFYRWDYINSLLIEIGRVSTAPYRINFDTSTLLADWNEIDAHAYDNAGNLSAAYIWLNHSTVTNTGLLLPSFNAAQTGGDGNGYQTNPANAYLDDGLFAVDTDSGNNTNLSCTNSGKDKHRFYNYGISLPGNAIIQGIEVRLDAKTDSAAGSPKLCIQLSWNGGSSWTTAKATGTLTTGEQTFILGGPADTWGRTWTTSQLSNANFRVRIINVSSSTARDFSLDWIMVRVTYR